MYKITKIDNSFQVKNIQDGIDTDYNITYLELEIRNTVANSINKSVFFQENIPECNVKYWKIQSNLVVEMTAIEKEYIDKKEVYEAKKIEFKGKRYKITVTTLSAEDTGFIYVLTNYPLLQQYCTTQSSIITEICKDTLQSFAYLDDITEYFNAIIESDSRFIKEDIETFNINN